MVTTTVDLDAEGVHKGYLDVPVSLNDSAWSNLRVPIFSFKNGDGPDEVHEMLRALSQLLSQREPGQPYSKELMGVLTRLALVATAGLAVGSQHRRTRED